MKLASADILRLLPEHLSEDPGLSATGAIANPVIAKISRAIPSLLIWARLGEQDPQTFLPPLRRLAEARGQMDPLNLATLESLAWQFHVDFREVAKTDQQLAQLILRSIAWHRIKGTPQSMYDALLLCGFGTRYSEGHAGHNYGIYIEEGGPQVHWATYQLGFEEIADFDDLKAIVRICREMQPARCRLWRVYTFDYDLRPGCWSGPLPQNAWSNAWWSLWSGAYMPELPGLDERGLLVSWGKRLRILCEQWSESLRIAALQEKLRCLRIYGRVIPRWSEVYWSDFLYPKPPAVVVWNGCGILTGEMLGGEPWAAKRWPQTVWGGYIHNLVGKIFIGNLGINTILVSPPDFWPVWPGESWPQDANWLHGHPDGWKELPWLAQDWLCDRRLLNPRPVTVFASDLVCTVFDFSLQESWPDAPWRDSMWMNLFCIGGKSLFQGEQLFGAQVGEISRQTNFWAETAWPDRVWADSWQLVKTENLAGDCGFTPWNICTAPVFPDDFYKIWPAAPWSEQTWDDSFWQIRSEIRAANTACHCVIANSDAVQPDWPPLPWQEQVWFEPKTVGAKTSFQTISELSPDAAWLDLPWPSCAWQATALEDA